MDISKLKLDIYLESKHFFTSDNLVSRFNTQVKQDSNIKNFFFAILTSSDYEKKLVIYMLSKKIINAKRLQNYSIANVQDAKIANPGHFNPITKSANHLRQLAMNNPPILLVFFSVFCVEKIVT